MLPQQQQQQLAWRGNRRAASAARSLRSIPCRVSKPHGHESAHETSDQNLHGALAHRFRQQELLWHPATVIRNDALSADGNTRLVHLSIPDNVEVLYGRKVQGVVDQPRWIDSYTMPGQSVAVKLPGGAVASRLFSIASTPYESRRDSTYIDASLIEIAATRGAGPDDDELGQLGPGASVEVSQVIGRGFSSLLSSVNTFQLALEEGRPLLCIAAGTRGVVPLRALLSWTPVLAHATASKVSCLYACTNMTSAAFLPEWDAWREAGVNVQPVYTDGWDVDEAMRSQDSAQHAKVVELLDKALFLREGGFNGLAGSGSEVVVLLAGVSGDVASSVSKKLTARGVNHERILFADQF